MSEEGFTVEELQRVIARKSMGMQILAERCGILTLENVELMTIIDELQHDLAEAHQALRDLKSSDDLLAQVASDHAVVHAVPDDEAAVSSG